MTFIDEITEQALTQEQQDFILKMAKSYIWWKEPQECLDQPLRIVAQVMNIGTFDDCKTMIDILGVEPLALALTHAEIGQFNPRSWHYWHYRLGLAHSESDIPAMPQRDLGDTKIRFLTSAPTDYS